VVANAIELASARLVDAGRPPLPEGLTPHSLRHTFASVLFAVGEHLPEVMAQMGHTTERMTLGDYKHIMRRDPAEREALKALAHGGEVQTETPETTSEKTAATPSTALPRRQ
jgi:integrase